MKFKPHWIPILFLIAITAWLRLANLGYSDYQGDEIKALWRPAEGQSAMEFLYTQKKGPTEFLVTYAMRSFDPTFSNQLLQRLPFAREAAPDVGAEHEREAQPTQVELPGAGLARVVRKHP